MPIHWLFKKKARASADDTPQTPKPLSDSRPSADRVESAESPPVSHPKDVSLGGGVEKQTYSRRRLLPTVVEEETAPGLVGLTISESKQSESVKGLGKSPEPSLPPILLG